MARSNKTKRSDEKKTDGFLVVGIGASAGGIQALSEFFANVTPGQAIAYAVILHLSPDHDSQLAHVLQQTTMLPVTQVTKRTKVEPDHVYVVPPDKSLTMTDNTIVVKPIKTVEERRAPVDIFFRTLAETHGPNAVGVVLSGTGANGSMGIKRIKEMGGVTFVQNPREAEFNEMPRNSIATELADMILPVAEIPEHIIKYRDRLGSIYIPEEPAERHEEPQAALRDIFTQLRVRTGHDFSNYKRPTMLRRIERRASVRNLPDLAAYAEFLREYPEEANALLKDLLISVTNFFRDKKAFESLEKNIIPKLVHASSSSKPLRMWVAACATGEEAYSIAMIVAEQSGSLDGPPVQIFATDIDEQSIAIAREGLYTLNEAADVSPERLRRFFKKEGESFRVRHELREMVLFAQHNLIKDPPFSHLDLVSCRNLLIYLNHTAQERVLETIHFALRPGGYFFIGTSESVDGSIDLFTSVDKENHIFQSRQVASRPFPVPETVPIYRAVVSGKPQQKRPGELERISYNDLHLRLVEEFAPPSVVIDENYDIVHISENAGKYMSVAGGEPSNNLLKLVRPDIRLEVRTALFQAVQQQSNVEVRGVKVKRAGQEESINLLVRPVTAENDTNRGFILVVFEPSTEVSVREKDYVAPEPVAHQLEEELVRSRTQLQSALEQSEVQAEELRASNEELQAMNEELRSSTEELETSKEELQSINEELTTVNQELKVKIEELSHTNNNFTNLLNSIDIGVIFLDRSLRVNLFSPAASRLFNLIPGDAGRPLSDITSTLDYAELAADADSVLENLQTLEREVHSSNGRIFQMRILPYRTAEDRINGVVLTFVDITERRLAEIASAADLADTTILHRLSQRLVSEDDIHVIYEDILDAAIKLGNAQGGTIQVYHDETQQLEVIATRGFSKAVQDHFRFLDATSTTSCGVALRNGERSIIDFDDSSIPDHDGSMAMHLDDGFRTAQSIPLIARSGKPIGMVSTHWREHYRPTERQQRVLDLLARQAADIIDQRYAERTLREREEKYRTLFQTIDEGFVVQEVILDSDDRVVDMIYRQANAAFEAHTGQREVNGKRARELFPQLEQDWLDVLTRVHQTGIPERAEGYNPDLDRWISTHYSAVGGAGSPFIDAVFSDITERKQREREHEFLLKLSDALRPLSDAEEIEFTACSVLGEWLGAHRVYYVEIFEPKGVARVSKQYLRAGAASIAGDYSIDAISWTAAPLRRGEAMVVKDVFHSDLVPPEYIAAMEAVQQLSILLVPLIKNGKWTGVLAVGDDAPRDWKEEDVALARETLERMWAAAQRARAESAMRATESRMRTLMESFTDIALFTTDTESIVTAWNPGAENIFGYRAEEMIGKRSADIIFTPEDREKGAPRAEMRTALRDGKALDERWHIRKNGERFFASGFMVPLNNGERHIGFGKIAQDLTARTVGEQAIRERGMLKRLIEAQEEERQRISRDLHDHLGQALTGLRLKLEGLKTSYGAEPAMMKAIDDTQAQAKKIDDEVSFITWELRPTALDNLGLNKALGAFVKEWSRNYGIEAEYHSARLRKSRLTPDIEINLYRIAQEALNNVLKHAKAKKVDVVLEHGKKDAVLVIEDNGVGFDLAAADRKTKSGKGLGLVGMRERAALLGGTLEIESARLKGTAVIARVPARLAETKKG